MDVNTKDQRQHVVEELLDLARLGRIGHRGVFAAGHPRQRQGSAAVVQRRREARP
jgi:hypothetical protein